MDCISVLCAFPMQSLQGMDYVIKDKLLPEKVLDIEMFPSPNTSTFYRGIYKEIVQMNVYTTKFNVRYYLGN